jgi:hypothetical protein
MPVISITISGPAKIGKTIIGNLVAEYLENLDLAVEKVNFEDKFLLDDDIRDAIGGTEILIIEHTEHDNRHESGNC